MLSSTYLFVPAADTLRVVAGQELGLKQHSSARRHGVLIIYLNLTSAICAAMRESPTKIILM